MRAKCYLRPRCIANPAKSEEQQLYLVVPMAGAALPLLMLIQPAVAEQWIDRPGHNL
jgi:hypothetical protein